MPFIKQKNGLYRLKRRDFMALSGAAAAGALLPAPLIKGCGTEEAAVGRPNVILILADDLGYGDVCGYGCKKFRTPNIDSIAENGVRFTNGHVTAPVCGPSRAGLITGRYQQRFGFEFNAQGKQATEEGAGLPLSESTLADAMKAAGYATGMIGKSHLGHWERYNPVHRGFDEYFGFLPGANLYIEPREGPGIHFLDVTDEKIGESRGDYGQIYRDTKKVTETEYLTDAFTREAVDFIKRHREEPFFLYLPYSATHTPMQVTDEYYERFPDIEEEGLRIYAGMLSALDDGVGRIMDTLKKLDLYEDTVVFFLSDNGCNRFTFKTDSVTGEVVFTEVCYNDPLRAGKLTLFEGGQRVPFLMHYPRLLGGGKVFEGLTSSLDLFPTIVSLTGSEPSKNLDGVDLTPYLTGELKGDPHQALFWRTGPNSAVLHGQYKLVRVYDGGGTQVRNLLYDVSQDIGEASDLYLKMPEKARELREMYKEWDSEMVEPLWQSNKTYLMVDGDLQFNVNV